MQSKNKVLIIIGILILFAGTASFVVLQGQISTGTSTANKKTLPTPDPLEELKRDFPGIDYENDRVIDAGRRKRSEKYDKNDVLIPGNEGNNTVTSHVDWETGLPALPVKESDIVAIGKLTDRQAYLSNNKLCVYSELTIEIEKEFRNISPELTLENKYLKAEREGGIVRFPSGFETFYFVSGQRMPRISKRYLFFLSSKFPLYGVKKGDLYLLTAYELSDGKVKPLDNPGGGTHKIATFYKDKDETILLNDLRDVIN